MEYGYQIIHAKCIPTKDIFVSIIMHPIRENNIMFPTCVDEQSLVDENSLIGATNCTNLEY